jgi:hypothetical protein
MASSSNTCKNRRRKGYCEVVPCDQRAVASSLCGTPVCLDHGATLGGFTILPGFEHLMAYEKREEQPKASKPLPLSPPAEERRRTVDADAQHAKRWFRGDWP